MTAIRNVRTLAWQHEFDLVDDELATRHHTRERARRAAMHRVQRACISPSPAAVATCLPEQVAALPQIPMTKHAAHRLKNRGISLAQVLVVADFGFAQRSHGATRYALDKKARQLLAEVVSPDALRRTGSLDIVAVFSDEGALVTASHRTGRLRRDVTRH